MEASGGGRRVTGGGRRAGPRTALVIGLLILTVLAACALFEDRIAPYRPKAQNLEERFRPPGGGHPMGTDELGRDVASRVVFGIRPALAVGCISLAIAMSVGVLIGLISGIVGRLVDNALMLLMDAVLSFPTVLLAMAVVALMGPGILPVMLAVGFVFSPVFARIVRAEVLRLRSETFVEASRALGTGQARILMIHIVPNLMGKVVVQASITFALAIVTEASLSFLGLGAQPPSPSWGLMLRDARSYLIQAPWMGIFPGSALALTILAVHLLGDSLSEALNRG